MVSCTNKNWSWQDVYRGILSGAFIPRIPGSAAGDQIAARAIKMVIVEDSGEDYFCTSKRFAGMDVLAKELSGLYSDASPELALRVSVGMIGSGPGLCTLPIRSYTEQEMLLSAIGKGTDGKPLLRLAFVIAED